MFTLWKGGTIVYAQAFGEIEADPLLMSTVTVLGGPATGLRLHQHPFKVGGSRTYGVGEKMPRAGNTASM